MSLSFLQRLKPAFSIPAFTYDELREKLETPNLSDSLQNSPFIKAPIEIIMGIFMLCSPDKPDEQAASLQNVSLVCKKFQWISQQARNAYLLQLKNRITDQLMQKWADTLEPNCPRFQLPNELFQLLLLPCPFEPGKVIWQTHFFNFVPGELSLKTLEKLANESIPPIQFTLFNANGHEDAEIPEHRLVLMYGNMIGGDVTRANSGAKYYTKNQSFTQQMKVIENANAEFKLQHPLPDHIKYALPHIIDITASALVEYLSTKTKFLEYDAGNLAAHSWKVVRARAPNNSLLSFGKFSTEGFDINKTSDSKSAVAGVTAAIVIPIANQQE